MGKAPGELKSGEKPRLCAPLTPSTLQLEPAGLRGGLCFCSWDGARRGGQGAGDADSHVASLSGHSGSFNPFLQGSLEALQPGQGTRGTDGRMQVLRHRATGARERGRDGERSMVPGTASRHRLLDLTRAGAQTADHGAGEVWGLVRNPEYCFLTPAALQNGIWEKRIFFSWCLQSTPGHLFESQCLALHNG